MKKIMVLVLGIVLTVIAYCLGLHMPSVSESDAGRIAIFTPTTHLALQEIERGFKETFQALHQKPYTFTTFNANGNRTLLHAQAEEMVGGGYDVIVTIGVTCSQTVAALLKKKEIKTPHVFCAVDGYDLAQSLVVLNSSSTGVYVKPEYEREMKIFYQLKPDIKNMLLVYDPTHGAGLEKYKKEIEEYSKKLGIILHSVEIYQTNEIQQKVSALVSTMDAVLVLTDNTVVAGIDALIVLCNRYGVTLLASDLASGRKGAALACGITEYESGSSAAQKAYAILIQGKEPRELPVSAVTGFRVELNKDTMKAQNVKVDDETLQQLNRNNKC